MPHTPIFGLQRNNSFAAMTAMIIAVGLTSLFPVAALSQDLYGTATPDSPAALFFAGKIGMSEGMIVYRISNGEPVRLTTEPVRPAVDAEQFFRESGLDADELMTSLEVDSPTEAFLRLRLDPMVGPLFSIGSPSVGRSLGRLWVDSTYAGVTTEYRIEIVDGFDRPTGDTRSVSITPRPIAVPANAKATYESGLITLNWTYPDARPEDGDGVTSFVVYEEINGELVRLSGSQTLRQNSLQEYKTLIPVGARSGSVSFRIAASSFAGHESDASNRAATTVVDDIPPVPTANLEATATSSRSLVVSWTYDGEVAQSFNVYRSLDVRGTFERVGVVPADGRRFTDTTVEPGNVYHYQVTAIDQAGNEGRRMLTASTLVEDREPPAQPANLRADVSDKSGVRLTWDLVTADDLNTYVILRRNVTHDSGQPFASANPTRVTAGSFTDPGPTGLGFEEGAYYQFGVLAADSSANFSDTTFVTVQIPDNTAPDPPVVTARANDGVVTVEWNPSPSTDVTSYRVTRLAIGERAPTEHLFDRDATVFVDRFGQTGSTYVYSVSAIDSVANESVASRDTVNVRELGLPRRVRNVTAAFVNGAVHVRWSLPPDHNADRIRIYRAGANTEYTLLDEISGALTYTDPSGAPGNTYYVSGVFADGREGPRSEVAMAVQSAR